MENVQDGCGNEVGLEHAFDNAFGLDTNLSYLLLSYLLAEPPIDPDADPSSLLALIELQGKHAKAIEIPHAGGFNGNVFRKYAPWESKPSNMPVTEPNIRARHD